ncbi:6,7-dimethyl-8-ribityllumazine synthase [Halomonas sp. SpR8]|uniref:6,7-dimethyl-8-ribityllumazine synthase n=1 Tax=Halomonas sp. SpR8 TaxID=3050463 RepID=UPI0027E4CA08|nr:6,7-dimethyl-8-ribityllumazine synthase [Halomonas sp. SpR8]MDQ7728657.1 6,7-dimethyl-8-ribityllumazine synthase [Halomonas sp. SpR8]
MNQTQHSSPVRVAFIEASWHHDIVTQAREAFIAQLTSEHVFSADQVEIFQVAGAYEIPLQAKLLAKTGRYSAIVGAGFVIDGGIYRHEFVAQAVIEGMMQAQLETEIPILSVVLTPHHFHEHSTHHAFFHDHFRAKGKEAAEALVMTLENHKRIQGLR